MPGVKLTDVNPELVCVLCHGYFIDATAIKECLHSFCRSCIILYLEAKNYCPKCQVPINTSKPHLSLKPDKTRQDIVYKLVPGLFHSEMRRRQEFYSKNCHRDLHLHPEARGVDVDRLIYSPEDSISLSLEYYDSDREKEEWASGVGSGEKSCVTAEHPHAAAGSPPVEGSSTSPNKQLDRNLSRKRYLQCPAEVSMRHIKKFIRMKYELPPEISIELFYKRESLPDDYSLIDIAYIYTWKRNGPMRFYYRIHIPVLVNSGVSNVVKEATAPVTILTAVPATDPQPEPPAPALMAPEALRPNVTSIPQPEIIPRNETHPSKKSSDEAPPAVDARGRTEIEAETTKVSKPSIELQEKSSSKTAPNVKDCSLKIAPVPIATKPKSICYREASFPSSEKPADPLSAYDFEEEKLPIRNLEKLVTTNNRSSMSSTKVDGTNKGKVATNPLKKSKSNSGTTTKEADREVTISSISKPCVTTSKSAMQSPILSISKPFVTTATSGMQSNSLSVSKTFATTITSVAPSTSLSISKPIVTTSTSAMQHLPTPNFSTSTITPQTQAISSLPVAVAQSANENAQVDANKTPELKEMLTNPSLGNDSLTNHNEHKTYSSLMKSQTEENKKSEVMKNSTNSKSVLTNKGNERKSRNDMNGTPASIDVKAKPAAICDSRITEDPQKKSSPENGTSPSLENKSSVKATTSSTPLLAIKKSDVRLPEKQNNPAYDFMSDRIKRLEKLVYLKNKPTVPQMRSNNMASLLNKTMSNKLKPAIQAEPRQNENKLGFHSPSESNKLAKKNVISHSNDLAMKKPSNGMRFDSPKVAPLNAGPSMKKNLSVSTSPRPMSATSNPSQSMNDVKKKRSELERCIETENGCLSVSLLSQSQQEIEAKKMKMVEPDVSIQLMSFSCDKNSDATKSAHQNRVALSENSKAKENASCNESSKLCNSTKSNLSPPRLQPMQGQKRESGPLDLSSGTGGPPGSGPSVKSTKLSPTPPEKRRKMPPLAPLRVPALSPIADLSEKSPSSHKSISSMNEQKDFSKYPKETIEFLLRHQFNNNNNKGSEKLIDDFVMNCQNFAFTPPYSLMRPGNGLSPESVRK